MESVPLVRGVQGGMTRTEHLLVTLMEECNEVAQRVSKALRFGLAEVQPGQLLTNAQRIMAEVNDFIAVYQMIAGPVMSPTTPLFRGDPAEWMAAIRTKQEKVEKFLAFSAGRGLVSDMPAAPVPHPETASAADTCPPGDHVWKVKLLGGSPDEPSSTECVTVCGVCGKERSDDD